MDENRKSWEVAEPNEQPPRPWRTDPEGFRKRVYQQVLRAYIWQAICDVLVWVFFLAAIIGLAICAKRVLGQVPAQDMRDAKTMEAFDKAHRDVYGTGRMVKPGLRAYYVPGSQKSYITIKGVDKQGKVVDKRVVFINRQQALEWGRVNGERLSFTPLGVPQQGRVQKFGR